MLVNPENQVRRRAVTANTAVDAYVELASLSLTLSPDGEDRFTRAPAPYRDTVVNRTAKTRPAPG